LRDFRRDREACAESQSKIVDQSRLATLQSVVHEVGDHDRVLSARADINTAIVGRMAGRQYEPKR
jgi:hypothetical protein